MAANLSSIPRPGRPERAEWRWALALALLVMLATSLPYLVGFAEQGSQWRFSGFVFGVQDGNSYIAKMLSGSASAWLFRTPYTAQPQPGVLAFLPYILLGKLAAPPGEHVQLVALYHLFRVGAGILAILATYAFLAVFLSSVRLRRWGTLLAIAGGGLGWVLVLFGGGQWLGSLPLEFYSPEGFGFLALYGLPHLALARALLLWGLVVYLRDERPPQEKEERSRIWRRVDKAGIGAGLLWTGLGLAQPLDVVIAWAVLASFLLLWLLAALWQAGRMRQPGSSLAILDQRGLAGIEAQAQWRKYALRAAWVFLVSSPLVIYTLLASYLDPFMRAWTAQNLILSPHPLHYLLAYGLLLPFAVIGILRRLRSDPSPGWLPAAWAILLPFLAYAPYNLQRRLPEGIWVAWVVLALAIFDAYPRPRPSFKYFQIANLALFPSTLVLLAGGLLAAVHPGEPAFRAADEVAAFQYLADNAATGDVVLAAFETGNALPAWAPVRVVIGHGPESANLAQLQPQVHEIYQGTTAEADRIERLAAWQVRYVLHGPAERALGNWEPAEHHELQLRFQAGDYQVFEFLPAQAKR